MSSKGPFQLGKTPNIRIFSTYTFLRIFKKSLFLKIIFEKSTLYLLNMLIPINSFLRPGNEKCTSKELYYTIFEDKQVTTAAHFFRFQFQILTTKIIKSVDDIIYQSQVLNINNR